MATVDDAWRRGSWRARETRTTVMVVRSACATRPSSLRPGGSWRGASRSARRRPTEHGSRDCGATSAEQGRRCAARLTACAWQRGAERGGRSSTMWALDNG
uniref:Uncharacterized protein n=1 Tax=Arundo donax TaxID=35708 RepID=A0A0A9CCR1_ARUDO